ncbi:hypothetical protein IAR55_004822 [Kwoniella newhampshirensis]|uniref:Sulfhydryl oxidase n=1 Tax=Kwoniella newhampshirensis TaxID=1651941 RepID=A0AAW0YUA6_9TREE
MLGHMPRFVRLTLVLTVLIIAPTLYLLYPTPEHVPSPGDMQAGGIDSEHWRDPIKPNLGGELFEKEQVREWDGVDDELDTESRGKGSLGKATSGDWSGVSDSVIGGGVIMPKLGNATAKAELGRAAWRVLHLMTLRYPNEPTDDDRQALKSYFHLFSRLYPCGECAAEFQKLLKEFPPQTSSRKSASLWLCHVHNQVNARLSKPEFDCLTLDSTYDCGCGDETGSVTSTDKGAVETGKSEAVLSVEEEEFVLGDEPAGSVSNGAGVTVEHAVPNDEQKWSEKRGEGGETGSVGKRRGGDVVLQ